MKKPLRLVSPGMSFYIYSVTVFLILILTSSGYAVGLRWIGRTSSYLTLDYYCVFAGAGLVWSNFD